MAKSLKQYASENPKELPKNLPEQHTSPAADEVKPAAQVQDPKQIEQKKRSIQAQIEQGSAPQYILYTAIETIGLLTDDKAFTETCIQILDRTYTDLQQQSLLTNAAALAAYRLEQMQKQYAEKMHRQLESQLKNCQQIEKQLKETMMIFGDMEV